jgi:hypothetical protein
MNLFEPYNFFNKYSEKLWSDKIKQNCNKSEVCFWEKRFPELNQADANHKKVQKK